MQLEVHLFWSTNNFHMDKISIADTNISLRIDGIEFFGLLYSKLLP